MSNSLSTIFALSSAPGKAGVAVIRISGPQTQAILFTMAGDLPKPRYAALRQIKSPHDATIIDHALVLWFPAPASFTGEDVAEFHVHGGKAVIQGIVDALGRFEGVRLAEPGEFSRRAFTNGKLDLTAIEGLADLIEAETEAQRRQALQQSSGALRTLYEGWRSEILKSQALMEAAIDFSDEGDVPDEIAASAKPLAEKTYREICRHLEDGHRGEILREGFRVVLAGPPNAGKSSLLNALAKRDAAIVSDEAGTTRDSIEVRLDLNGYPVIVTDTAGIRESESQVEKEGIRRAINHAIQADLLLWVQDIAGQDVQPPPQDIFPSVDPSDHGDNMASARVIMVLNKIDQLSDMELLGFSTAAADLCKVMISTKTGQGLDTLVSEIAHQAGQRLGASETPAITRARHRQELEKCRNALDAFLMSESCLLELKSEDLRQAAQAIGRITGRIDVEDVLEEIFSSFCIGK